MSKELIGAVLGAVLLAASWVTWAPRLYSAQSEPVEDLAARHIAVVASAAEKYIKANYAALAAGSPVVVTVAQLKAAPGYYLDSTFVDTTPFQHTHAVFIRPVGGKVRALVAGMGGQTIDDITLARLSPLADTQGRGGSILGDTPTQATGAVGDWVEDTTAYPSAASLTAGHLAVLLTFDDSSAYAPYLHRFPIAGTTEPQTMHANIEMGGNAVNGASSITIGGTTIEANRAAMINALYALNCAPDETVRLMAGTPTCVSTDSTPVGAVVGFALAACPDGWIDYAAAQGRFLVGVGSSVDAGGHAASYGLGDVGGENMHQLTIAEMAKHSHTNAGGAPFAYAGYGGTYQWSYSGGSGWMSSNPTTSSAGGDQPHNIIPSYVTVRWCVKG